MSNIAIYPKGKDKIAYFLIDAWRDGNTFFSVSGNSVSIKTTIFDVIWTNDVVLPTFDTSGNRTGWDKAVSEITPAPAGGTEIAKPTHNELLDALNRRRQVADMTFAQLDNYIENNVTDLASAKIFMKLLAKAVLAVIKIQDKG
jgi:hypothetical protein